VILPLRAVEHALDCGVSGDGQGQRGESSVGLLSACRKLGRVRPGHTELMVLEVQAPGVGVGVGGGKAV